MPAPPPESDPAIVSAMGVIACNPTHAPALPSPREPSGLAFGKPKDELREWWGGAGGGERRLLGASVDAHGCRFGASVVPPPLAPPTQGDRMCWVLHGACAPSPRSCGERERDVRAHLTCDSPARQWAGR